MTHLHDTPATRAIQKPAGPSGLVAASNGALESFFMSAQVLRPGPVAFRVNERAFQPRTTSGLMGFVKGASGGLAEDGSRVFIPHRRDDDLMIDVWHTSPLQKEKTLLLSGLGGFYDQVKPMPDRRKLLEAAAFLDPGHLALCLGNGRFVGVSVEDERIWMDEWLGGSLGAIAVSPSYVAVSVFSDGTPSTEQYCGVKVHDKHTLLEHNRLEVRSYFSPQLLGVIPCTLRLSINEDTLLYRGSSNEGEARKRNSVSVASASRHYSRLLFEESDTDMTHDLSNLANDGSYAVVGREVFWFGPDHHIGWQSPRPAIVAGGRPESLLTPDGNQLWIGQAGRVVIVTRGSTQTQDLLHLGYLSLLGAHGRVIYVQVREPSSYRLLAIDAANLKAVADTASAAGIQPVCPYAYEVSLNGTLCVGDGEGNLREFDSALRPEGVVPTTRGSVSQVVSDSSADRVFILTAGGATLKHVPGTRSLDTYVKCAHHRPTETGTDVDSSISLSGRTDYPLMFYDMRPRERFVVHAGGRRNVEATSVDGRPAVIMHDYSWQWDGVFTGRGQYLIESRACAIALMRGLVVVALDNRKILVFDAMLIDGVGDETVLMNPGPYCHHLKLADDGGPAKGLCVAGEERLVMWTTRSVSVITFSNRWEITSSHNVDWPGVENIRWDSKNNRLLLARDHHLSICTMDVVEIGRLYLLPQGRHLIHVPYPAALLTGGLNRDHPGYFWTDADDAGDTLLDVTDREGRTVADSRLREDFLQQYRSEFMVRQALGNYSRFVETLNNPVGQAVRVAQHALLPCLPDSDVDPNRQFG